LSALSKWTDINSDGEELSDQSAWTSVSDSEKTPTNKIDDQKSCKKQVENI
jgi:hypothetical protein